MGLQSRSLVSCLPFNKEAAKCFLSDRKPYCLKSLQQSALERRVDDAIQTF